MGGGWAGKRGVGWEYVHICIDDASRIAVTGIFPDEKAVSANAALRAAVACYQSLGITVTRVMPPSRRLQAIACRAMDNGSCYKAKTFAAVCRDLKLKHIRTEPYTPKSNGKLLGDVDHRLPVNGPRGSSRPPCANGPIPAPAQRPSSAKTSCRNGPTCTIGIARTAA